MMTSKRWCFTLNNYSEQEEQHVAGLFGTTDSIGYLVAGREVGDSGTPHLQGFVVFTTRKSLIQVRGIIGARIHAEISRGLPAQAAEYCKKDGDFIEFGTLPEGQGRRTDWDEYKQWVIDLGRVLNDRDWETT